MISAVDCDFIYNCIILQADFNLKFPYILKDQGIN